MFDSLAELNVWSGSAFTKTGVRTRLNWTTATLYPTQKTSNLSSEAMDLLHIIGYSDSDWASQIHCHCISGFAFFISTGVVSWSSMKPNMLPSLIPQKISFGFINYWMNFPLFSHFLYLWLYSVTIKVWSHFQRTQHSMDAPSTLMFTLTTCLFQVWEILCAPWHSLETCSSRGRVLLYSFSISCHLIPTSSLPSLPVHHH